jgi:photosystem II stability/assembly factor-like uncharacterized protein
MSLCHVRRACIAIAVAMLSLVGESSPPQSVVVAATPYDPIAFSSLEWRLIGPFRGGRSVAVAGSAARPNEYYHGTTGGGVFKTINGGISWFPTTDGYFGGTIGAIAVSESNADVVYVGTGERSLRGNVSHGDGMFKSVDGGRTWTSIGFGDSRHIGRVRIHPTNPDIVYVAVFGHVFGPHNERGVYKTIDGGRTWRRVLFRNDTTGAMDLAIDATNPNVLYAAFWDAHRKPWLMSSGGPGSGLFKTADGGETWTELTRAPGLPAGVIGKIGVAVSPTTPSRIWASVEAIDGGLFRSDDGGTTWAKISSDFELRRRPWYYSHLVADPKDPDTVYYLGIPFLKSGDGGKTFQRIPTPHADHHDLWIAPNNPSRMVIGNDGGAQVSSDGGRSWTSIAQATAQFYHVHATNDFPYKVCGAQQDNTTLCGPSRAPGGIDIGEWQPVGGGESGWVLSKADDPNIVYAGSVMGELTRTDLRRQQTRVIDVWPDYPFSHPTRDQKYRFTYTFPLWVSPHDPDVLYAGSQVVHRTRDGGSNWEVISPDLTRNDPATQGPSGGPITPEHTGPQMYSTVFVGAESPHTPRIIWTGSDDGLVHVTRDDGRTWTDVTPPEAPKWMRVSSVEPSRYDAATAYVAANQYQMDDNRPILFRTTDFGKTWTSIVNGIPAGEFTRVLREDSVRRGLLYAGTERSVYVSFDDGRHWQSLRRNLPLVPVHDLVVKENDLVITAHGRSFWILDDVSPLRQLTPEVVRRDHLFAPATANRAMFSNASSMSAAGSDGAVGGVPSAANPPSGAIIYYWLRMQPASIVLEFLDAQGAVIRSFAVTRPASGTSSSPDRGAAQRSARRGRELSTERGLQVFAWDLRYPSAATFRGMNTWAGDTPGPMVMPGTYTVRLTVNGASQTQTLKIDPDPRSTAIETDNRAKFEMMQKIVARVSEANNAVRKIRNVNIQLAQRADVLAPGARVELQRLSAPVVEALTSIENQLHQSGGRGLPVRLNDKLARLGDVVDETDGRPTRQVQEVYDLLVPQLNALRQSLDATLARLGAVNDFLRSHGQPPIVPSTEDLSAVP